MSNNKTWTTQALTDKGFARPSSTVILLREGSDEPELFMVRRHADASFGAAYAFPGGVMDASDSEGHEYCEGRTAAAANTALGLESGGLNYFVAAIRELFEETGVLLATHDVPDDELVSSQAHLNSGSLTWNEFINEHDLRLHCDQLRYFSHWITPDELPKRYTTRFFIAELPPGQLAHHDERELTDSKWITATNALRAGKNGLMTLHFPTRKTLESLAEHHSVAALLTWASECEARGVTPTQPAKPGELP